jgi:hypothetical protein
LPAGPQPHQIEMAITEQPVDDQPDLGTFHDR